MSSAVAEESIYENDDVPRVVTTAGKRDWKFGLFGCFDDPKLCVLTFFVPCYAIGMNADSLGDDCLIHGILPLVGLNFGPVVRWRMRQERHIEGSMLHDVLLHTFCPCCALVQEAREIGWTVPQDMNEVGRTTSPAATTSQPKPNNAGVTSSRPKSNNNTDSGSFGSVDPSTVDVGIDRQ